MPQRHRTTLGRQLGRVLSAALGLMGVAMLAAFLSTATRSVLAIDEMPTSRPGLGAQLAATALAAEAPSPAPGESQPRDAARSIEGAQPPPAPAPPGDEGLPPIPPWLKVFYRGDPHRKVVALTFDDGPRPEHFSSLLDILARFDVKATFFFTGVQAEKYPSWVRLTVQAGHEIGNHTYDHLRLPQIPDLDKRPEIGRCQQAIWDITGTRPRFVRPPGCELDAATLRAILERGLVVAMYDVNLRDDTPDLSSRAILSHALACVRPGSIILGHSNVEATVEMLPELISTLQARGYRFVTLSELAAEATPPRPASARRGAG